MCCPAQKEAVEKYVFVGQALGLRRPLRPPWDRSFVRASQREK